MADEVHTKTVRLPAPPETVFAALTEPKQLEAWFAEHAAVDLPDRYEFWGRYTPAGKQALLGTEPLRFAWAVTSPAVVTLALAPAGGDTDLTMTHAGVVTEEVYGFWDLSLGNLVRHLAGLPADRFDYSTPATDTAVTSLAIDAPADAVFAAITEPARITQWIGSEAAAVDLRVGGRYDFGWDHGPGTITELAAGRALAYTWTYPASPETLVRWTVEPGSDSTVLTVTHSGFTDPALAESFRQGWFGFLLAIRDLVE